MLLLGHHRRPPLLFLTVIPSSREGAGPASHQLDNTVTLIGRAYERNLVSANETRRYMECSTARLALKVKQGLPQDF